MQLVNQDLKTSSIGVFDFLSIGVHGPTRLFKFNIHSKNACLYDYYWFDLYPYVPGRRGGGLSVSCYWGLGYEEGGWWVSRKKNEEQALVHISSP